jgi:DNA-binding helix-hairpin-helix protein with protein kinase domain
MHTVYSYNGGLITLSEEIGGGGEGAVWKTDRTGYVAKIYTSPDAEKKKKIEAWKILLKIQQLVQII